MEQQTSKRTRSVIRDEAYAAWEEANYHGLIANCTGSGKSSIAIKAADAVYQIKKLARNLKTLRILLVTYTIVAGEEDWPAEFRKWKQGHLLKYITNVCYAGLDKLDKTQYDLVILDEAHHITPHNYKFFSNNPQPRILMLTGTPPSEDRDWDKVLLLQSLGPIVYSYPLDEGVADGNLSNYELWIVDVPLDDKHQYLQKGSKKKGYTYVTEKEYYGYLNALIIFAQRDRKYQWAESLRNKRMHFLSTLRSKTVAGILALRKINPDKRVVIFAGSKSQADELCPYVYYTGSGEGALTSFRKGKINRIASVRKLNESVNLPDIDMFLIMQTYSNEQDIIQRMGRALRFRPNHTAVGFLFRTPETEDEKWIDDAIKNLDHSKIKYYHSSKLYES